MGNTIYGSDVLSDVLNIKKELMFYNSKYLEERMTSDDDAVSNLYQNNGYLFSSSDCENYISEKTLIDPRKSGWLRPSSDD